VHALGDDGQRLSQAAEAGQAPKVAAPERFCDAPERAREPASRDIGAACARRARLALGA